MSTTTNKSKGTIFLKLVLDTLRFRMYYETYVEDEDGGRTDTDLDDALHKALVRQFRSVFFDLSAGLDYLDYEVIEEFYTDQVLSMDGYELTLSGDYAEDAAEVEDLRSTFEEEAGAFLQNLPNLVSNLEPSTEQRST